jgi:hypothetical protein
MQLHALKLVTIVIEKVLRDQILQKIMELGATGCTHTDALGIGSRGARKDDVFGGNARIEVVCSQAIADKILTYISHHFFEPYACIAWVADVSVVRGSRYVKD